jgi:hypothetical protein
MIVEAGYDPEGLIYDDDFELFTDTIHSCGDPTEDPLMFVSKNKTTKRKARNGKRKRSSTAGALINGLMICVVVL